MKLTSPRTVVRSRCLVPLILLCTFLCVPRLMAADKAPATQPRYLEPIRDPRAQVESSAQSELFLSKDEGEETDPILRIYGDYPSTKGSLGRLMGDRRAPDYEDPTGKVVAFEVLKNGDVLFGPNLGAVRRPSDRKDPNSRLETDVQHSAPIDFWWDATDRKLHVRSILLTENGDPADLAFRRAGDETYPYGPPMEVRKGMNLGTIYWMGWGAEGHGFNDRAAQIYATAAENISRDGSGGKLHFSTTPVGSRERLDRMVIGSDGNVGVGAPDPEARLHVAAETVSLAMDYPSAQPLEAGDVVAIDAASALLSVAKTTQAYDRKVVGVVVAKPAVRISQLKPASEVTEDVSPVAPGYAIAHGGRVAVKVSAENGPIEPGDYLTSSSTPGVAMKATQKGAVVGKALQAHTEASVGTIQMLADVTWYTP